VEKLTINPNYSTHIYSHTGTFLEFHLN